MLGLGSGISATKLFQPNDISECVLAFHASDGVSVTEDSGILIVDSWMDQAGTLSNGSRIYATQVSTKRPVWNYSHITFDGANDRLDLNEADGTDVEVILDTSDGGWTILAVYSSDDWSAGNEAILGDPDNSQNFLRHKPGSPNQVEIKINNNIKRFDLSEALNNGRYHAIMVTASADSTSELICYIDGVALVDTETIANTNDLQIEQLAAKAGIDNLDGNIKHIVVYDKILSSDERTLLYDWASRYTAVLYTIFQKLI